MADDFIRLQDPSAILLYSFLQCSSNCAFQSELEKFISYDSDLGDLQTDGNVVGYLQAREPVPEEEIFRIIGAQLAEMGDALAAEIEAPFINSLAQHFMTENMSKEEVTRHLSEAVLATVQRIPLEMEQEKAMLIIAMLLAKKVADAVPSLLRRVFRTTVDYINSNLHEYVDNLAPEH